MEALLILVIFIEDTVECMRGYGCFEPESETDFNTLYLPEPQPERRKIGRNEPWSLRKW